MTRGALLRQAIVKMSPGAGGYKVDVFSEKRGRGKSGGGLKRVELNNFITLQGGDNKPVQQQLDSLRM